MQLTPQQDAFVEAVLHTDKNLALKSVAGSGKTYTMVYSVNQYPGSGQGILACAFNKRIAVELAEKMPSGAECKTVNSLGHGACIKLTGKRLALDQRKCWIIAEELGMGGNLWPGWSRAFSLIRSQGLGPVSAPGRLGDLTLRAVVDLIEDNELDYGHLSLEDAVKNLIKGIEHSIKMCWNGFIDFDDQLYFSVLFQAPFKRYQIVMIDEAQDLSPIQHQMLKRMRKVDGGRIIAVGDPHQAIYAFRGADSESIPKLVSEFNMQEMPLTVSFRCPKAIVAEAQKYVSHIEAADSAPDGLITHRDSWSAADFEQGDVILCRNNAPLVTACWELLKEGVGASIVGRDIATGLKSLLKKHNRGSLEKTLKAVHVWKEGQVKKLMLKDKEVQAENLKDKVQALSFICERALDTDSAAPLQAGLGIIDRMFAGGKPKVLLSTIHKAKGLEWPRVYFLDSHLIPSRFAKTEKEQQQEKNLAYVGITRAQQELVYINSQASE